MVNCFMNASVRPYNILKLGAEMGIKRGRICQNKGVNRSFWGIDSGIPPYHGKKESNFYNAEKSRGHLIRVRTCNFIKNQKMVPPRNLCDKLPHNYK